MKALRTTEFALIALIGGAIILAVGRHAIVAKDSLSPASVGGLSLESFSNVRFFVGGENVGTGSVTVPWDQLTSLAVPADPDSVFGDVDSPEAHARRLDLPKIAGPRADLIHAESLGGMSAKGVRARGLDLWLRRSGDMLDHVLLVELELPAANGKAHHFLIPVRARLDGSQPIPFLPEMVGVSAKASLGSAFAFDRGQVTFSCRFVDGELPEQVLPYWRTLRLWTPADQ